MKSIDFSLDCLPY